MLDILLNRRSTRKYTDEKITEEQMEYLLKCALLSPSSKNKRPWEIIVVQNKEYLELLSKCKPIASAFIKDVDAAFVIAGDATISDVWIEDTSIVSINIQLAAETLGLGSCWSQIRNRMHNDNQSAENYISNALDIPDNLSILSIIGVGHKAKERAPYSDEDMKWGKVSYDKFGNKK